MVLTREKVPMIFRALKDTSLKIRSENVPIMIGTTIIDLPYLLINNQNKQRAIFISSINLSSFFYIIEDTCSIIKKCTSKITLPFIIGKDIPLAILKTAKSRKIPVINQVKEKYKYYSNE